MTESDGSQDIGELLELARRIQLHGQPLLLEDRHREAILAPVRREMRKGARREPSEAVLGNIVGNVEMVIIQWQVDIATDINAPLTANQVRAELSQALEATQGLLGALDTMGPASRHAVGDKAELVTSESHRGARIQLETPPIPVNLETEVHPMLEDLRQRLVRAVDGALTHPGPRPGRRQDKAARWLVDQLAHIWRQLVGGRLTREAYSAGPWPEFVAAVFKAAGARGSGARYARELAGRSDT